MAATAEQGSEDTDTARAGDRRERRVVPTRRQKGEAGREWGKRVRAAQTQKQRGGDGGRQSRPQTNQRLPKSGGDEGHGQVKGVWLDPAGRSHPHGTERASIAHAQYPTASYFPLNRCQGPSIVQQIVSQI